MGLCICRDWLLKERSSFTPVRDSDERANPKGDRFFPFRSSLPTTTTATVCTTSQVNTSQPIERINSNNHATVDEDRSLGGEISYNKISVREPLSKVLAERAILEHHYNEVDGEGESCFYEEIAGATNTSVTSTIDDGKLGRQSSDEADVITDPGYEVVNFHQHKSEPCYAVIDKSLNNSGDDEVESAVISVQGKSIERRQSDDEDYSTADPGYEVVNFHQKKSEPCYAVIDKNVNNSGDSETGSAIISVPGKPMERRQSDDEDYLIADPGYEVINSQKSEPCYAVIDKNINRPEVNRPSKSPVTSPVHIVKVTRQSTDDDEDSIADPGYEVINAHQQKSEPCYAVIDKNPNTSSSANQTSITTTRPLNSSNVSTVHRIKVTRQSTEDDYDDDAFADPGYEVINSHQSKGEPCYAVIDKITNSSGPNSIGGPSKSSSISPNVQIEKLIRQSTDDDDDLFADPGYEVINNHHKKSEPC